MMAKATTDTANRVTTNETKRFIKKRNISISLIIYPGCVRPRIAGARQFVPLPGSQLNYRNSK